MLLLLLFLFPYNKKAQQGKTPTKPNLYGNKIYKLPPRYLRFLVLSGKRSEVDRLNMKVINFYNLVSISQVS